MSGLISKWQLAKTPLGSESREHQCCAYFSVKKNTKIYNFNWHVLREHLWYIFANRRKRHLWASFRVKFYKSKAGFASAPFSVLKLHGFSKVLWMSGQFALVFQVLAKSTAVPSLSPPAVVKSSAWMLLKLPQSPAQWWKLIQFTLSQSAQIWGPIIDF